MLSILLISRKRYNMPLWSTFSLEEIILEIILGNYFLITPSNTRWVMKEWRPYLIVLPFFIIIIDLVSNFRDRSINLPSREYNSKV